MATRRAESQYTLVTGPDEIASEADPRFSDRKDKWINAMALTLRRRVVGTWWFEGLVLVAILGVAALASLELQSSRRSDGTQTIVDEIALGVFFMEMVVRVASEGDQPWRYLVDSGLARCFDAALIVGSGVRLAMAHAARLGDSGVQVLHDLAILRALWLLR